MIVLSIKTDQKLAEVGLFRSEKKLEYIKWQAHRELSVTVHEKIERMLSAQGLAWGDIEGVVFYEGPGSFTGLRIGASVANALASDLNIPAVQTSGDEWVKDGLKILPGTASGRIVMPKYGEPARTTKPRH